ncbi:hypothetical protein N9733_08225 [Akkermansiaceae bacterium]|nr:hypothetical protein [Akkermansiaceae bacterium]MDB4570354.1 hypothetical protein [Akkermansiaceae bacterium]
MPATASELLDTFEASVREGLDEFMLLRGANYESGFSRFEGKPTHLKPGSNAIPGLFWFILRYSLPGVYLEIGFGDRESVVEPMLGDTVHGLTYHPGIIAEAAGRNEGGLSGSNFVIEIPFMRKTVPELTSRLKEQWDVLESPSEVILDRAQQILGRRMVFALEEQRQRDRQRDSIQASVAFHSGDYSKAIRLLSPYEEDEEFTAAHRKMLALAKKK